MTIERIYPDGLQRPTTYTPVVRATGGSTVYISGQVPVDSTGALVGAGDFEVQVRQVFTNLRLALTASGADFSNVVKITIFIVGYHPGMRDLLAPIRAEAFGDTFPASTLVGVEALAVPGYLIEIEAVAVVP